MSATTPATVSSIPSPRGDLVSLQQSVMALKQNVEVVHRAMGAPSPTTTKTSYDIAMAVAIARAQNV